MIPYDEHTEKQLGILRIITWAMMIVGPLVYLIIATTMDPSKISAKAGNDVLVYMFIAVSLSVLIVAGPIVIRSQIKGYRRGDPQGRSPAQFFMNLGIIQMAFVEAVYIYGFVAFLLTGKIINMLYFYPIGIIGSYFYWPRRGKYEQLLEKLNEP